MENKRKEERQIKIPESQYRAGKRALQRQRKTKRLAKELWFLFKDVK